MLRKKDIQSTLIIILLLLFIIIIGLILIIYYMRINQRNIIYTDKQVSENLREILNPTIRDSDEDSYTEIMGFGEIYIDSQSPDIYLINPESNDVYLSFVVACEDEKLYESGLITPGKMDTFDVYGCLDAGKHNLVYSISSYDINTKALLWSGVNQNQEITIYK